MRATLKTSLHPNNQTIVLASNNAGKLAEFERLFAPLDVCIEPQKNFNVSPAQEPFKTFVENALAKARHASAQTGLPAIADDSGICADALSGRSEEHTSELQSRFDLVCRLLLEKTKTQY